MKIEMNGIVFLIGVDVVRNAINRFFIFYLEGAEHPVPYDKGGAVVLVDVFLLRAMVNPVVGRCSEDIVDNGMYFSNVFCMHPELKKHGYLVGDEYNDRVESQERYREKEYDLDILHPAQSK